MDNDGSDGSVNGRHRRRGHRRNHRPLFPRPLLRSQQHQQVDSAIPAAQTPSEPLLSPAHSNPDPFPGVGPPQSAMEQQQQMAAPTPYMPPPHSRYQPARISPPANMGALKRPQSSGSSSASLAAPGKKAKTAEGGDDSFPIYVQSPYWPCEKFSFKRNRHKDLKEYGSYLSNILTTIPENDRDQLWWIRIPGDSDPGFKTITELEEIVPNTKETPYFMAPMRLGLGGEDLYQLFHFQKRVTAQWDSLIFDEKKSADTLFKGFRHLLRNNPLLNIANGDVPSRDAMKAAFEDEHIEKLFLGALERQQGKHLTSFCQVERLPPAAVGLPRSYLEYPKIVCSGSVEPFKETLAASKIRDIDPECGTALDRTIKRFALQLIGLKRGSAFPYVDPEDLGKCIAFAEGIDVELDQFVQGCKEYRGKERSSWPAPMKALFQKLESRRNTNTTAGAGKKTADLLHAVSKSLGHGHIVRRLKQRRFVKNEVTRARFIYNQVIVCAADEAVTNVSADSSYEFNVGFDSHCRTCALIFNSKTNEFFRVTLKPDAFIAANVFGLNEPFLVAVLEEKVETKRFEENASKCAFTACVIWKQLQHLNRNCLPGPIPFLTIHGNILEVYILYHKCAGIRCDPDTAFQFRSPAEAVQCNELGFLQFVNASDVCDDEKLKNVQIRFQKVTEFDLADAGQCGKAIVAMYNIFQYCVALFTNIPNPSVDDFPHIEKNQVQSLNDSRNQSTAARSRSGPPSRGSEAGGTNNTSRTGGGGGESTQQLSTAMVEQALSSAFPTFADNIIDPSTLEFPRGQGKKRIIVARSFRYDPPAHCKFARADDVRLKRERRILKEILETVGPCQGIQRFHRLDVACGDTLQALVTEDAGRSGFRARTPAQFVEYCRQLLQAVQTLHNGGWVHSDISPANVCVKKEQDDSLVVTLIDFEFAKRLDPDRNGVTKHTYPYNGTRDYVAPELKALDRDGNKEIAYTVKMDMYSVGKVLRDAVPFDVEHIPGAVEFLDRLTASRESDRWTATAALSHSFLKPSAVNLTPPDSCHGSE